MDISAHQDKKNDECTITFNSRQITYLINMLFWYRDESLQNFDALNERCKHISLPAFDEFVLICDGLICTIDDQLTDEQRYKHQQEKKYIQEAKDRLRWKNENNYYLTCLQNDYEMKKSM